MEKYEYDIDVLGSAINRLENYVNKADKLIEQFKQPNTNKLTEKLRKDNFLESLKEIVDEIDSIRDELDCEYCCIEQLDCNYTDALDEIEQLEIIKDELRNRLSWKEKIELRIRTGVEL